MAPGSWPPDQPQPTPRTAITKAYGRAGRELAGRNPELASSRPGQPARPPGRQSSCATGAHPRTAQFSRLLDNGAGYASELGQPEVFKKILDEAREELTDAWESAAHTDCTVSCPDCLRSYDNRRLHGALDWRLALDMLDLAAGEQLKKQRWLSRGPLVAQAFTHSMGSWLSSEIIEGLPVLMNQDKSKAVILGHPLWRRDPDHLTEQQSLVLEVMVRDLAIPSVSFSDLYEVDRQPLAVLRGLI
jgi:DEAD/DEAH box helicase domain-containing protein